MVNNAEPDQIKWRGIRPTNPVENIQVHPGPFETSVAGVTRAQIIERASSSGSLAIARTVPAEKTLYICSASLSFSTTTAANASLFIRDAADLTVFYLFSIQLTQAGQLAQGHAFPMPVIIPALFDVATWCSVGVVNINIQGWEQDA